MLKANVRNQSDVDLGIATCKLLFSYLIILYERITLKTHLTSSIKMLYWNWYKLYKIINMIKRHCIK